MLSFFRKYLPWTAEARARKVKELEELIRYEYRWRSDHRVRFGLDTRLCQPGMRESLERTAGYEKRLKRLTGKTKESREREMAAV